MAVDNYLKAFRIKDGISLGDAAYILTGDVPPTDPTVPAELPNGTLFTDSSAGIVYVKRNGAWYDIGAGAASSEDHFFHTGMTSSTVSLALRFTWTSAVNASRYFLSVRHAMTVEFSGINGAVQRRNSAGATITLQCIRSNSGYVNAFQAATPGWYFLPVGEYQIAPTASGTLYMDVYSYEGYGDAISTGTSNPASNQLENPVFKWNGNTFISSESN
jgi:hypothetical protein